VEGSASAYRLSLPRVACAPFPHTHICADRECEDKRDDSDGNTSQKNSPIDNNSNDAIAAKQQRIIENRGARGVEKVADPVGKQSSDPVGHPVLDLVEVQVVDPVADRGADRGADRNANEDADRGADRNAHEDADRGADRNANEDAVEDDQNADHEADQVATPALPRLELPTPTHTQRERETRTQDTLGEGTAQEERERERERERDRESVMERDRERDWEKIRQRDRDSDRARERERERERELLLESTTPMKDNTLTAHTHYSPDCDILVIGDLQSPMGVGLCLYVFWSL